MYIVCDKTTSFDNHNSVWSEMHILDREVLLYVKRKLELLLEYSSYNLRDDIVKNINRTLSQYETS